jgi:hypothetical protein
VEIKYEFVPASMVSLMSEKWSIANNPLFIAVFIAAQAQESTLVFNHVAKNSYLNDNPTLKDMIARRDLFLVVGFPDNAGKTSGDVEAASKIILITLNRSQKTFP